MINRRGFTLVEVIVIIIVIAILATITTLGLNRYLEDGRDNRRNANVTAISEALEKYYDQKGEYPSCAAITAAGNTVATNTLKGLDESALLVPEASTGTTNSIRCGTNLTAGGTDGDFIEYVGDGSATCTGTGSCLSYTLRYRSESNNTVVELNSRRTASLASSGAITNLNAAPSCYTAINLTWAAISNATSYEVQRATDEDFTNNLTPATSTVNSLSVGSLNPGQEYFFRARPIGAGQNGNWSNVASATTLKLGTPTLTATVNSSSQITSNWTASSDAGCGGAPTTYTFQRATNNTFTQNLNNNPGETGLSFVSSGLAVGTTYYFRVQAVTTSHTSDWSNITANSTVPNPPTNVAATVNSATQYTISWTASPGATSYVVRYGTTTSANTYNATTSNTSLAITANILQGTTHYFRVFAVSGGIESAASSTVNGTTPINAPPTFNVSGSNNGVSLTASASTSSCPSGTTRFFLWRANGSNWVSGTQYTAVTYNLSPGQGVSLTALVRCQKGSVVSSYRNANNSVSYTRPGMNLNLWLGNDGCSGGFCGREVYAGWNNVCGTGAPRIYARQLSAYGNWIADSASGDVIRWKGASGAGVWVDYYDINIGCTSGARSIQVPSAYKCTGCS